MPSLLDGMNVTLGRAALEARTCSTNGQRGEGWGEEVYLEKCRLGEWVQLVVGVREKEGRISTCAGSQAALAGIIVALRSFAFALGFPTLIAR